MQRYRRSKPRISKLSRDKGKLVSYVSGSFDRKVIVEICGSHMNFQIPLLVIVRRSVSIMSAYFTNRRETHLRIRRCLSSYGIMRKRPNVVRSLGWDPGYHEVIRNGPENKIHLRKVPFRSSGMIPVFSSGMF